MREVRCIDEVREVSGVTKNLFPSRPPLYLNSQVNRHSASTSKICSPEPASQLPSPGSRVDRNHPSRATRHLARAGGVVRLSRLETGTHAGTIKPVPTQVAPGSHRDAPHDRKWR